MKNRVFYILLLLPLLVFSGCRTTNNEVGPASKRQIIRALGQGLVGPSLKILKKRDQRMVLEAEYRALEYSQTGSPVMWISRDGQSYGTVTPGQPYQVGTQNCRQYSHSFVIKGAPQTMRGGACRNEDGSWTPLL